MERETQGGEIGCELLFDATRPLARLESEPGEDERDEGEDRWRRLLFAHSASLRRD